MGDIPDFSHRVTMETMLNTLRIWEMFIWVKLLLISHGLQWN